MAILIKSVVVYFILMFIGSNIGGFIINGLFSKKLLKKRMEEVESLSGMCVVRRFWTRELIS
jgi:glycerol uptake facilitator-like aquaporin